MTLVHARQQLAFTTLLAAVVPLAITTLCLRLIELPEPYRTLAGYGAPSLAVAALAIGGMITFLGWRLQRIWAVFDEEGVARQRLLRRRARGFLLDIMLVVIGYELLLVAVVFAETGGGAGLGARDVGALVALVLLAGLLIALPILLEAMRILGNCFGGLVGDEGLLPALLRNLPAVALTGLAALTLPLYQFVRYGGITPDVLVVTATLLVYAVVITALNLRYTLDSLVPVMAFLESASPEDVDARTMKPRSLDLVGVVIGRMQRLLERVGRVQRDHDRGEQRLRQFAEAASDWFFEIDEQLCFSWVSPKLEEITGVPASAVVGLSARGMGDAYQTDDYARHQADLAAHRPYRDYRFGITAPDGSQRVLSVSAVPWFGDDGSFRGYRGVGSDITERVQAERRLLDQESQLAQAQKMEAVGQLTGGVAHDFNNLLTAVMGNLELARMDRCDDPGRVREHVDGALQAARRGADLVQRLLAFSRRQELRPQVVNVLQLVVGMEDLLRRALGEAVDVSISADGARWMSLVDPGQLESAVLNLAINARDAMDGGGRLAIEVGNVTLRRTADGLEPGEYIGVSVVDEGCGMSESERRQAFEPFYTTKPTGMGSGLGLSMVYGFARQSGGNVTIDSAPGEGTRVTIYLPTARADAVREDSTMEEPMQPSGGETILVVEDDDAVRVVVSEALTDMGYRVLSVPDGAAALVQLEDLPEIELVVTDVVLPGGYNGLDVIDGMRAVRPDVRFLMISGYARDELEAGGEWVKSIPLLGKPFRLADLQKEVARVLAEPPLPAPEEDEARAAVQSGLEV